MADYQIVPITEEHIVGFHDAVDAIARERKYLAFLEGPALATTQSYVLNNIEAKYPHLVVLSTDSVVGWCDIIPNTSREVYFHSGDLGIGLLRPFRGQGIGRRLIEQAIKAGFDFGLTRIELDVRENNTNAIALYKSLGFEIEGLHKNAICVDGKYEHSYSMALLKNR
jgi:ribosomal protein S18 acetylase RimI-like enzyme